MIRSLDKVGYVTLRLGPRLESSIKKQMKVHSHVASICCMFQYSERVSIEKKVGNDLHQTDSF